MMITDHRSLGQFAGCFPANGGGQPASASCLSVISLSGLSSVLESASLR